MQIMTFNGHNTWNNHCRVLAILLACGCLIIRNLYIISSGYCRTALHTMLALLKTTTSFTFLKSYWFYFNCIFSRSHDFLEMFSSVLGWLQRMACSYFSKPTWIHFSELMTDSSFLNRALLKSTKAFSSSKLLVSLKLFC